MGFIKIVLLCIGAAIVYGIIHDQITARVCVEYFTIGHPPIFHTNSPTLLGLGWGVVATWWVGAFLGVPLAFACQGGERPKLTAGQLTRPLSKLLAVMGLLALAAGCTGYLLTGRGIVPMPEVIGEAIPKGHQLGFIADWWAHMMSYVAGLVGGVVLMVSCWRRRKNMLSSIVEVSTG